MKSAAGPVIGASAGDAFMAGVFATAFVSADERVGDETPPEDPPTRGAQTVFPHNRDAAHQQHQAPTKQQCREQDRDACPVSKEHAPHARHSYSSALNARIRAAMSLRLCCSAS